MAAYFSRTGGGTLTPSTNINSDIIPALDNTYTLGNAANTVDTNPYQTLCSIRVASMDFTSQNSFAVIDNFYHT